MTKPIEPQPVVQLVESFVDTTLDDAAKYDNSEPLDASNVYSLHVLAGEIYALGFEDGQMAEGVRAQRQRSRDARKDRP